MSQGLLTACRSCGGGREAGLPHDWPLGALSVALTHLQLVFHSGVVTGAEGKGGEEFHLFRVARDRGTWEFQGSLEGGSVGWRGQGLLWEIASKPGLKGHDRKAQLDLQVELFSNGMGGLWREHIVLTDEQAEDGEGVSIMGGNMDLCVCERERL